MTPYYLNLLDLVFTLHALRHGAVELNPLMGNTTAMILYKVFAVGALCRWLGSRPERIARIGRMALTAVYSAVIAWHIYNLAAIRAAQ